MGSPKPLPLVEGKASAATFDAEQKPLSSYVLGGVDYRQQGDSMKVGAS